MSDILGNDDTVDIFGIANFASWDLLDFDKSSNIHGIASGNMGIDVGRYLEQELAEHSMPLIGAGQLGSIDCLLQHSVEMSQTSSGKYIRSLPKISRAGYDDLRDRMRSCPP